MEKKPKQIHQIEFVARDVCMCMFPHKDTRTSILTAQCKEPAAEIKGRGINIIHDKKKGNIFLLLSPPTHFPNSSFSPRDQKVQTRQKTLKKGPFPVGLIKHCELVFGGCAATQGKLQV